MQIVRGSSKRVGVTVAMFAVLAVGLISASSAAAASPEFRGLAAKEPTSFSISGGSLHIETATGAITACESIAGKGSITGPKTALGSITLSGCSTFINYCHGKGLPSGELKTVELEIIPVYTVKAPQKVGLEFRPKSGSTFAALESPFGNQCELAGSLIAQITPINSATSQFTLVFSGNRGTQTPKQYENPSQELVNSWLETVNQGYFTKESWNAGATFKTGRSLELVG
jgi:hypothetical protein